MGSTPGLYIIQFIPSSFNWKSGGITLNQKIGPINSWEPYLQVSFTILSYKSTGQSSTLNLRIPFWTSSNGGKASLNNQDLSLPSPGSFLSLTRKWTSDDSLTLQLPITLRTEALKDERPEYASIQAILFGPYLLAGLTTDDWDIDATNSTSITDWIIPIPPSSRSQLASLSQQSDNRTYFVFNSNRTLQMSTQPKSGTDESVRATFRLIQPIGLHRHDVGRSVMIEPFDLPGMVVAHQGPNNGLRVEPMSAARAEYVFRVVDGLSGDRNSVSFESEDQGGCFVSYDGTDVKLACREDGGEEFGRQASFRMSGGTKEYHPICFVARGVRRNFVLEPLLSLRDESYTVYFNIVT